MFEKTDQIGYTSRPPITYPFEELAAELIWKDVLFLVAGLGLCIALILKGVKYPISLVYYTLNLFIAFLYCF